MIPFDTKYIHEEIEKYTSNLKGKKLIYNNIKILMKSLNGKINGYIFHYEDNLSIIPALYINDKEAMKLTPEEIIGCYTAHKYARGKVGIVGLGLGYFTLKVLENKNVTEVIVYESNREVIDFYYNSFGDNEKLKIIQDDAFKVSGEEFDFFFVDIYYNKLSLSVVEHYVHFNNAHHIQEYTFWGMERFLLSCKIEDILNVYIPELWMSMSRELFSKYNNSLYKDLFSPLPENEVEKVLVGFQKTL